MVKKIREDKNKLFEQVKTICENINKKFQSRQGDNAISYLGSGEVNRVPTFSSGAMSLDMALGGGYPWGRIVEIYGPEGGGKTTLTLHAIATVQKLGFPVAFVDAEHALDIHYARNLGVDVSTLMVSQPDTGEQALNIALELVKLGTRLIVVDSVAALTPESMIEEIGGGRIGEHARLMSQGTRTLNSYLLTNSSTIIFTNQTRCAIGNMAGGVETTGGKALRFYATQRIEVKRIGSDSHGDIKVNNIVVAKVAKNKIAPPFLKAEFKIRFGKGIDLIEQVISYAEKFGLLEKKGAWCTLKETGARFNGQKQLYDTLDKNEDGCRDRLEKQVAELVKNADVLTESANLQDVEAPVSELVQEDGEVLEPVETEEKKANDKTTSVNEV